LSLCLIKYHEDIWENGGTVLPFVTSAPDGDEWSGIDPFIFIVKEVGWVPELV
jgi:hypothetical protein